MNNGQLPQQPPPEVSAGASAETSAAAPAAAAASAAASTVVELASFDLALDEYFSKMEVQRVELARAQVCMHKALHRQRDR